MGLSRSIAYFRYLNALRTGFWILKCRFQPAEGEHIAGLERALLDRRAVDEGAIARSQVGQPDLLLAVAEPGVLPRDTRVVERNVGVALAADRQRHPAERDNTFAF